MKPNRIGRRSVNFDDGTCWPRIDHDDAKTESLEWTLRYGMPSRSNLLVAAEYIAAYGALVMQTQRRRNEVCSALAAVEKQQSRHRQRYRGEQGQAMISFDEIALPPPRPLPVAKMPRAGK